MYVVRDSQKTIHAICSRKSDAEALAGSAKVDKTIYTVTKE